MDRRLKGLIVILVGSLFLGALYFVFDTVDVPVICFFIDKIHSLELKIYDSHMNSQGIYEPSQDIVAITLDEKSDRELGPFPWPRSYHGKVIRNLKASGAKVIAFDVAFIGEKDAADDKKMARAAEEAGNVITVVFLKVDEEGGTYLLNPFGALNAATVKASPELKKDRDGIIRRAAIDKDEKSLHLDPLFLSVIKKYCELPDSQVRMSPEKDFLLLNDKKIPITNNYMFVNFCGKTYPRYSYADIYKKNYSDELVKDKIVLIFSVTDPLDRFKIPRKTLKANNEITEIIPGGEIHANLIQTLLEERWIDKAGGIFSWSAGVLLCILIIVSMFRLNYIQAIPVLILELAVYYFVVRFFFVNKGLWIEYMIPSFMVCICWFGVLLYESNRVRNLFTQFLPRNVVEKILRSEKETELGSELTSASVLFSDIRNYTTLSENLPPEKVLALLNEYHSIIHKVIKDNKGYVLDYMGDGVMVSFGVPDKLENHSYWAVKAGLEMQDAVRKMNCDKSRPDMPLIRIGVGIASGEVAQGFVGEKTRKEYTVIGDVVNTASRLEGLTKNMGSDIIIDENTFVETGEHFKIKDLGEVTVKGKSRSLKVFGVLK
ncbi:MAG: CHASE2 domain-containing protein [Vulcanimicrobiota bacterium]